MKKVGELEERVSTIAPLQRQLDAYKRSVTDAEVRMSEQTLSLREREREIAALKKICEEQRGESQDLAAQLRASDDVGTSAAEIIFVNEASSCAFYTPDPFAAAQSSAAAL